MSVRAKDERDRTRIEMGCVVEVGGDERWYGQKGKEEGVWWPEM